MPPSVSLGVQWRVLCERSGINEEQRQLQRSRGQGQWEPQEPFSARLGYRYSSIVHTGAALFSQPPFKGTFVGLGTGLWALGTPVLEEGETLAGRAVGVLS